MQTIRFLFRYLNYFSDILTNDKEFLVQPVFLKSIKFGPLPKTYEPLDLEISQYEGINYQILFSSYNPEE